MATVHTPGDGHTAPATRNGSDGRPRQWLAYTDARKQKVITDALFILKHNVRGMRPCNDCFSRLLNGRTFDNIIDDPAIFISYDPDNTGRFATTLGNDITVTEFSIRMGRWTVGASLVHELAHVNGAPGDTHDAEGTLLCCGFSALHDPTIIGANESSPDTRWA
jgi:hypothetical protein